MTAQENKKKVLITGASGQAGAHLCEMMLEKGFDVHGTVRRHSVAQNQTWRIRPEIYEQIRFHYCDILDSHSINNIFKEVRPELIFHTAAQSFVKASFEIPQYTIDTCITGTLNILEAMRNWCPDAHMVGYGSSEQFGNSITKSKNGLLDEDSPMEPVSPYAVGKIGAFHIIRNYRHSYNLFASNLIAFNYEGRFRGLHFVSAKTVYGALQIKKGLAKNLVLGNLDAMRDWSDARDTMDAAYKIVTADKADDYVVASGVSRSIRELCNCVFSKLGMDYRDYVISDAKYLRPEELRCLRGDATKIKKELNWNPKYSFDEMIDDMIEYWSNNG